MLPNNFSSSGMSSLFPSQGENPSLFGPSVPDTGGHLNSDISQALKSLCPTNSWFGQPSLTANTEDRSRTNLIINYLPQSYEQSDLQCLFERIGPIRQCKLIRDKTSGASLCYGFVDYLSSHHAALAIQTYHGYETEGKRLRVAYASSGGRRYAPGQRPSPVDLNSVLSDANDNIIGWELIVSNLPDMMETEIMRLFSHFGSVLSVKYLPQSDIQKLSSATVNALSDINCNIPESMFGNRMQNKGVSVAVIYEDRVSCESAVSRLHGVPLPSSTIPLSVRIAGPVTREACALMLFNSRSNSEGGSITSMSSRHSSASANPLSEKMMSLNLPGAGAPKLSSLRGLDSVEPNENTIPLLSTSSLLQPRPIIRNKGIIHSLTDPDNYSDLIESVPRNQPRSGLACFNQQDGLAFDKTGISALVNKTESSMWPSVTTLASDTMRAMRTSETLPLRKLAIVTPYIASPQLGLSLSQVGGRGTIYLKLENLQPTGSVCLRAMENYLRKLYINGNVQHVVCPSTGNAGVAAAFVAQNFNMACTVVTPDLKDPFTKKRLAIEAPSAKLITHGSSLAEAAHRAEQMVSESNQQLGISAVHENPVRVVHPYETTDISVGYENIVEELPAQQPDAIVVPVGGGALLAGIVQGLWNRGWSTTHIIAMEPEGADCFARSVNSGHSVVMPKCTSIVSSLCAPSISNRAWSIAQFHPITSLTCSDDEALSACRRFLDDHGLLIEPAAATALAAVYNGGIHRLQQEGVLPRPCNIAIIITGGRNINMQMLEDLENAVSLTTPVANGNSTLTNLKQMPPFGLRQLHHLLGPDSILADIDRDEICDGANDMQTSGSGTSADSNVDSEKCDTETSSPSLSMRS